MDEISYAIKLLTKEAITLKGLNVVNLRLLSKRIIKHQRFEKENR